MNAEERKARSEKLAAAIEEYLEGQEFTGMLGDWLIIGNVVRVDEDGDPNGDYFLGFSGGSMLQHHAYGLVAKCEEMLKDGTADG